MLRSHLCLTALAFGALSLQLGCGDSGGSGGGGGGSEPVSGVTPPARPEGAGPGDGEQKLFGTSKIHIGTKTRSGEESNTAWADYGYDLDGMVTGNDFSDHCKPNGGTPESVFPDGSDGIDNAFGKVILPLIKTAAQSSTPDLQASINDGIANGTFNLIVGVNDLGSSADYDPLSAFLIAGKQGNGTVWKSVPELLESATDPFDSKVKFADSYLAGNTWVSGKGTVTLSLSIAGFDLALDIRSAVLTMDVNGDRTAASNGIISGVLDTEALVTQLRSVVGAFDPSLCEGSAVEGILDQIRKASDIMKDGSQDPSATCNGISIGLGFDAVAVTVDGVGDPAEPQPAPCGE